MRFDWERRDTTFAGGRGIMDVIRTTGLGSGQKAQRHLGIVGTPCAETSRVSVAEGDLTFQDLALSQANRT